MNIEPILIRMRQNADAIVALAATVTDAQARWRPSHDAWSLLEVIVHLLDEEREDFRVRIEYTLFHTDEDWPPIDPAGWVLSRNYNARSLAPAVEEFLTERSNSLRWLSELDEPEWTLGKTHPVAGQITAGDLLASWLAHDFLHIRQLNELHYQYYARQLSPARIDYAGDW